MKKLSCLNQERNINRSRTVYKQKHILNGICWNTITTWDRIFHSRKHHYGLWYRYLVPSDGLKLKSLIVWLAFLQTCSSLLHNIFIWWTWVWWTLMDLRLASLWCFHQLFEFLFWRHPFTLVSKSVPMKQQTYLHLLGCACKNWLELSSY